MEQSSNLEPTNFHSCVPLRFMYLTKKVESLKIPLSGLKMMRCQKVPACSEKKNLQVSIFLFQRLNENKWQIPRYIVFTNKYRTPCEIFATQIQTRIMKSCVTVQEPTVNASNKIIAKKRRLREECNHHTRISICTNFLTQPDYSIKKPLTSCSVFKRGSQ